MAEVEATHPATGELDQLTVLCRASEVPVSGGLRVELPGRAPLAVFHVGVEYFVTDDHCTHGEGSLSDGTIVGEEVRCPFHRGKFCLRTGRPTGPPCVVPLRTYVAELRDGVILAALSVGQDRSEQQLARD